jgi:hypothetical protein
MMQACGAGHPPQVMSSASILHSADLGSPIADNKASAGAARGASRDDLRDGEDSD